MCPADGRVNLLSGCKETVPVKDLKFLHCHSQQVVDVLVKCHQNILSQAPLKHNHAVAVNIYQNNRVPCELKCIFVSIKPAAIHFICSNPVEINPL